MGRKSKIAKQISNTAGKQTDSALAIQALFRGHKVRRAKLYGKLWKKIKDEKKKCDELEKEFANLPVCPISGNPMKEIVVNLVDGKQYDKEAIEAWIKGREKAPDAAAAVLREGVLPSSLGTVQPDQVVPLLSVLAEYRLTIQTRDQQAQLLQLQMAARTDPKAAAALMHMQLQRRLQQQQAQQQMVQDMVEAARGPAPPTSAPPPAPIIETTNQRLKREAREAKQSAAN